MRTSVLGKIPHSRWRGRRRWIIGCRLGKISSSYKRRIIRSNVWKKDIHRLSSLQHESVRAIWSSRAWVEDARVRRCEMKGWPCGMMRIAKFKWPRTDNSSRLEQVGFAARVDATKIILFFFDQKKKKMIKKRWSKNRLKDGPNRVCRNCLRGSNRLLLITCRKFWGCFYSRRWGGRKNIFFFCQRMPNRCQKLGWMGITLKADVMSTLASQAPRPASLIRVMAWSMSW